MFKLELQWKKGINAPYEVKNLAINGAFDFWQELVGATRTINTVTTQFAYSSDMFKYYSAGATSASTDSNGVTGLTISCGAFASGRSIAFQYVADARL